MTWVRELLSDAPQRARARALGQQEKGLPLTIASDGTTLFVPVYDQGRLLALDAMTGRTTWSFDAGVNDSVDLPIVLNRQVYCNVSRPGGGLVALDKASAKLNWEFRSVAQTGMRAVFRPEQSITGIACRHDAAFIVESTGIARRVELKDGKELWEFKVPLVDGKSCYLVGPPLISESAVVFGGFDGSVYCLSSETGQLRWRLEVKSGWQVASPVCSDGRRLFVAIRESPQQDHPGAVVAIGDD
jgi:outer membrane protein assembly factor BamB